MDKKPTKPTELDETALNDVAGGGFLAFPGYVGGVNVGAQPQPATVRRGGVKVAIGDVNGDG